MMKKKRTIIISALKLKNVRDNIRSIIYRGAINFEAKLIDQRITEKNQEKSRKLRLEREIFHQKLENSIIFCPICRSIEKNMVFNSTLKQWFCTDCYKAMTNEYHARKAARAKGADQDDFNLSFYKSFIN